MRWLTAQTTQQTILLTALFLLMAVATILLACGPVAQPAPADDVAFPAAQAGGGSDEPTAEPEEPTTTPRPTNNYPKLTASLQNAVRKYESGELSETEAAALILAHHGAMVLVKVDTSTNIDTIDTWMAEQEIAPRHKNTSYTPHHIYAYVKVSLLGSLSQRDGITLISAPSDTELSPDEPLPNPLGGIISTDTTGVSGQSSPSEPILPIWLPGYPYPRLGNQLEQVVYRYDNGELTEAEAAAEFDFYEGSSISVEIAMDPGSAAAGQPGNNTDAVVTWLKSQGSTVHLVSRQGGDHRALAMLRERGRDPDTLPPELLDLLTNLPFQDTIGADIRVSLAAELSQKPGVIKVTTPQRIYRHYTGQPPGPSGSNSQVPPISGQATTPVTSQGVSIHGALAWHNNNPTAYRGNGVKVGVIDLGFDG